MDSYVDNDRDISLEKIEKFLAVHGQKGVKTLSLIGQYSAFMTAIHSEIGRELLNDLMIGMEKILPKIIELKAKDHELAEYRVYRSLLLKWSAKIATVEAAKRKIIQPNEGRLQ